MADDSIPAITRPRSLDQAWAVFGRMVERARAYASEEGLTREERAERYAAARRLSAAQQKIEDIDARARLKARTKA